MGLAQRVKRLERGRGPAPCPGCGWDGTGPVRLNINPPGVIATLDLAHAIEEARERPEDFCGVCGRKTVLRVPSPLLSKGARP